MRPEIYKYDSFDGHKNYESEIFEELKVDNGIIIKKLVEDQITNIKNAKVHPEIYIYDSFDGHKNHESEIFQEQQVNAFDISKKEIALITDSYLNRPAPKKFKNVSVNTENKIDTLIKKSIREIGTNPHNEITEEITQVVRKVPTRNVGINVNVINQEIIKEKEVITETVYIPQYVEKEPKDMKNVGLDAQSLLFEEYKKSCKEIGIDPVSQLFNDIKIQLSHKAIDTRDENIWEKEIEKAKKEGINITMYINDSIINLY